MTRCVGLANVGDARKLALLREGWHEEFMARRKKTPETSRIARVSTVAYARKQKPGSSSDGDESAAETAPAPDAAAEAVAERAAPTAAAPAAPAAAAPSTPATPTAPATPAGPTAPAGSGLDAKFDVTDRSQPVPQMDLPADAPPPAPAASSPAAPKAAAPSAPSAAAARPRAQTADPHAKTLGMPVVAPVGSPPEMPDAPVPAGMSPRADAVEDPTHMPGPNEIPSGSPGDPAPAPGRVPPGDSRSLRRRDATTYEFALIYRRSTFVITRFGIVGTRGQWRVVEYPTSTAASHAYAKECSRFVSDGFSDYRD
jgi:hypothetical protein